MTTELYQKRDKIASNSYTLHSLNPAIDIVAYGDIDAMRRMFKGNVTFIRSASGMRTTCYLHFFGDAIVKAAANGCGYDTQSEAIRLALGKLAKVAENDQNKKLVSALLEDFNDGVEWKRHFETKGIFAAHIGG